MTLVEVTIAIVVMTVAAFILSSTLTSSLEHTVTKREQAIAVEAAMNTLEVLRSEPFMDVFALYNSVAADDPDGPGTAPGPTFAVDGLDPVRLAGGGARPIGTIVLPEHEGQLREDVRSTELGLPRDLDGDFVIDDTDHSADYLVLPVLVRVEWEGRLGRRTFEMATMLADLPREVDDR